MNFFSMAGRVTLAKSILQVVPMYSMQSFLLPKLLYYELDRKSRNFIWGSMDESRKPHLVNWE